MSLVNTGGRGILYRDKYRMFSLQSIEGDVGADELCWSRSLEFILLTLDIMGGLSAGECSVKMCTLERQFVQQYERWVREANLKAGEPVGSSCNCLAMR